MGQERNKEIYVAFLRGINVGGHNKVPMAELRKAMNKLNFEKVDTVLNSGNIIFNTQNRNIDELEKLISEHLKKTFGFAVPAMVRKYEKIRDLLISDPFKKDSLTKDQRFYISFLRGDARTEINLPWESDDKSFRIIGKSDNNIFSILDLSLSNTPKGMEALEKHFGKDITSRNWNTIVRINKKTGGSR
jgi:uncharacterized protein (DUF1697 family)